MDSRSKPPVEDWSVPSSGLSQRVFHGLFPSAATMLPPDLPQKAAGGLRRRDAGGATCQPSHTLQWPQHPPWQG